MDARTDLFSLGAVLYETATGRQAFPGDTIALAFDAVLNRDLILPSRSNPQLTTGFDRVISMTALWSGVARRLSSIPRSVLLRRISPGSLPALAATATPLLRCRSVVRFPVLICGPSAHSDWSTPMRAELRKPGKSRKSSKANGNLVPLWHLTVSMPPWEIVIMLSGGWKRLIRSVSATLCSSATRPHSTTFTATLASMIYFVASGCVLQP